MAECLSEKLD
jgi:hypothetical protein